MIFCRPTRIFDSLNRNKARVYLIVCNVDGQLVDCCWLQPFRCWIFLQEGYEIGFIIPNQICFYVGTHLFCYLQLIDFSSLSPKLSWVRRVNVYIFSFVTHFKSRKNGKSSVESEPLVMLNVFLSCSLFRISYSWCNNTDSKVMYYLPFE